jgi:Fuc2NAc and GlcNAc transferase
LLLSGLILVALSALVALGVGYAVLRNAEYLQVMASPNARSSHTRPTPSGGGIGIVAGSAVAALSTTLSTPWPTLLVLICGLVMAAIGFLDDRRPLPAAYRLAAHLILATIMVALCIPAGQLVAGLGLPLPWAVVAVLAVAATVYWVNIFNFMDGIDGIAAAQAAFMLGGAALLAVIASPVLLGQPIFWWLVATAAAAGSFLVLNWAPARIFMGDAGSTYLGFVIAFFALATVALGWLGLGQWLILGAAFFADATVTIIRRLRLREKLTEAHRRHAYQRLARRWQSHRKATGLFIAINLFWLLPCALLARDPLGGLFVAILAYAPVVVFVMRVGAGRPEEPLSSRAT